MVMKMLREFIEVGFAGGYNKINIKNDQKPFSWKGKVIFT